MNVSKTAQIWLDYHRAHSKNNTVRAYEWTIGKFCEEYGDTDLLDLSVDNILSFLNQISEGRKPQTKRVRFSHLTAFFYFIKNNIDSDINNPCVSPMLRKLFRQKTKVHWDMIEKETVDEIIFIPQKVADRLKAFIRENKIEDHDRVFPICYEASRAMVRKAGQLAGIYLRPHDLRRHSATFASRAGVPIEIVSKVILRHANLSTTQRYLGKVSDTEAMRWIENLYA